MHDDFEQDFISISRLFKKEMLVATYSSKAHRFSFYKLDNNVSCSSNILINLYS